MLKINNKLRYLLLFSVLVIVDQTSKLFSLYYLPYKINQGGSWGLDLGSRYIYMAILLVVTIFFLYLFKTLKDSVSRHSVILILSGSASNLVDRFFRGGVVDFISIKIWPTFNLADVFITVGVIVIGYRVLKS